MIFVWLQALQQIYIPGTFLWLQATTCISFTKKLSLELHVGRKYFSYKVYYILQHKYSSNCDFLNSIKYWLLSHIFIIKYLFFLFSASRNPDPLRAAEYQIKWWQFDLWGICGELQKLLYAQHSTRTSMYSWRSLIFRNVYRFWLWMNMNLDSIIDMK